MAGRQWYTYTGDDKKVYAVQLSSSYANVTALGFKPMPDNTASPLLPQGTKMRYVNAVSTNGAGAGFRRRRFAVSSPDAPAMQTAAGQKFKYGDIEYVVTSRIAERRRVAVAAQTGLKTTEK